MAAARKPSKTTPKTAPKKKAVLSRENFVIRREQDPSPPLFGWTFALIQAALQDLDSGRFDSAEQLYHGLTRDPRIGSGLRSRVHGTKRFPFSLSLRKDAPELLRAATEILQEDWASVLSDADQSEVLRRLIMFGFCICRSTWTLRDGQQQPALTPWTSANSYYDHTRREWVLQDEDGREVRVPHGGDGKEWVVFSLGGPQPWLNGEMRRLGRLFAIQLLTLDRWVSYNDIQGGALRKAKTPALPREQDAVKKFWQMVASMRVGDTALCPEGFDLDLLESKANGHLSFKDILQWVEASKAICLLGHNLSQETRDGSKAATEGALDASRDLSVADVGYLSAALAPLLRCWLSANFSAGGAVAQAALAAGRPLRAFVPTACWDTRPPEDAKAISEVANTYASAFSTFLQAAAAAQVPSASLNIDWRAAAVKCGLPQLEEGRAAAGPSNGAN